MQDTISRVANIAIITIDYKGMPITTHSNCQKFCNFVRNSKNSSIYCQKCDAHGGFEAYRIEKPYIYKCHHNIVDMAIPIIVQNKYLGAIMAGQATLLNDTNELEQITFSGVKDIATKNQTINMYKMLPVLEYSQIKDISHMLFELINYTTMEKSTKKSQNNNAKNYSINSIKEAISSLTINTYIIDKNEYAENICTTLKPAIRYIYKNKNKKILLKDMASLCFISSSYFSKLFKKKFGTSFQHFIIKLKIEWSIELIEKTNLSIEQISESLGYTDCSYFIRMFKKLQGDTPLNYKKNIKPSIIKKVPINKIKSQNDG